jgi:hypothetical protein
MVRHVEETAAPLGGRREPGAASPGPRAAWAGPAHVGDEPVHLQGVGVPPFPPVGQPLVKVTGGGESRHDRSGQPFVLAESVGDPLRTGGILEVAGITDQHPSRAGRLPEEHRERRHGGPTTNGASRTCSPSSDPARTPATRPSRSTSPTTRVEVRTWTPSSPASRPGGYRAPAAVRTGMGRRRSATSARGRTRPRARTALEPLQPRRAGRQYPVEYAESVQAGDSLHLDPVGGRGVGGEPSPIADHHRPSGRRRCMANDEPADRPPTTMTSYRLLPSKSAPSAVSGQPSAAG